MSEPIRIEYGVIIPTYPEATVVVKPEGQDRLLVFAGNPVMTDGVVSGAFVSQGDVDASNLPDDDTSEALMQEVARLRDEVASLEDCREHLRQLGQISGCDHVESPDCRAQQVRHIEEAFEKLQDENRELRSQLGSPT